MATIAPDYTPATNYEEALRRAARALGQRVRDAQLRRDVEQLGGEEAIQRPQQLRVVHRLIISYERMFV